jgi:lysozyme
MSQAGLLELIGHEAIVLSRYRDAVGVWTIGVGHTRAAGPPDPAGFAGTLSLAEALALFRRDVGAYERAVAAAVTVAVSQTEFDALVSFHFNTGAIGRAALVSSLNRGERERAAREFLNWRRPPEIVGRRQKEQQLFARGIYANGGKARVIAASASGTLLWGSAKLVDLRTVGG